MNPRAVAAQCLYRVIYQGKSLTEVLKTESIKQLSDADRALTKDICFGALRWHYALDQMLDALLVKPLKKRDKDVECLIRAGLYQLHYQNTADHAAVNETVVASKLLKKSWSKGLINGVLRSFIRDRENIAKKIKPHTVFPLWMIKKIKQAWPEQWKAVLIASNVRAPMTLRVNHSQGSTKAYLKRLDEMGIVAIKHPLVDSAIELKQAVDVQQLSGFKSGSVSVQDASAQLAGKLLAAKSGMRVLDACAAPGGKTGHIAELCDDTQIIAIDTVAERLSKVKENMERLGKPIELIQADAGDLQAWYDGKTFDRILLDAPCSALGVMRRHPDIKVLRQESDISPLIELQQYLLSTLWQVLKEGGRLLYVTCSILPEENDQQIANFIKSHAKDAKIIPIDEKWGMACQSGRQILPDDNNMDGFYYALIEKRSNSCLR